MGDQGINVLLEILQNLWEIHKRDDLGLTDLLEEMAIKDLKPENFEDPRAGLESMRTTVHRRRFPSLENSNDS